ncbi:uncharacterized protein A1O9_01704 [Exophiala aquamarina CBS 119918]|uniref:Enoyl reductase (ER) domain-containing protein n=1 Tax=Exophiala aquamarina CBS 119918 TaxID=1182545 RepID=A0A072PV56_9EURO|nr:uncharacterized protein A1O9_01704 [Exophiala aquamarina CBS 119918]KEF63726.1 hypothetical protein A1O9_01704 [Exophiala aquamarina CBS 119918]
MVSNNTLVFAEPAVGIPVAGKNIKLVDRPLDLDKVPSGGFVARVLYSSYDPYLRHKLVPAEAAREFVPFDVGAPIVNGAVVEVLKVDQLSGFKVGDNLVGMTPIAEYASVDEAEAKQFNPIQNPYGLDVKLFLGALGLPGITAYSSLYEVAKPKSGETIFISAASGAIGQLVGQLALREGLTVIGSVGSDEKLDIIKKQFGFHHGFNYRTTTDIVGELKRLAPQGIDIYYDNVGGEQLEAAITALKDWGRIVACGAASQYSIPYDKQYGIRNTGVVISKRIRWQGFTVFDDGFWNKYGAEHQKNVQEWLKDGSLKAVMSTTHGIDNAADGLISLFKGENVGKAILEVSAP